jgi:type I restriction enzyme S subunit
MMQAYAEYKDSGVDWLGEIPAGWSVVKSRRFSFYEKGKATKPSGGIDNGLPLLAMEYLRGDETPHLVKSKQADVLASEGDILLLWDGSNAGEFLRSKHGVLSATIAKVSLSNTTDFNFMFHAFKASENELKKSNNGMGIPHVSGSEFKELSYALPPLSEQTAIAEFLDEKTGRIDELVGIKRRQIELLAERKQILIQNAVTKGLDPNAPLKDSGIDWIGQIPAHWEVKRNAILFQERKDAGNENLPVLSVSIHSGVSSKELSDEENIRSAIKIQDRTAYKEVQSGYVAYNMMRAWQGGIGAVRTHGMVSPAYVVAKPTKFLNAEYFELLYRTSAFIWQMDSYSKGITDFRKRLYWEGFRELVTLVPPIKEQREIIKNCASESQKIDAAITIKQNQITKLNEYKTTLINAAVTGKIKVTA